MGSAASSERVERIGTDGLENMHSFKEAEKTAFVVGYTGDVGKALVRRLRRSGMFSKVTLIGKQYMNYNEDMMIVSNMEQKVLDFDNMDAKADAFSGHDVGYCCVGAGESRDGQDYERVDRDYTVKIAELAKKAGTTQFHLVSSSSADASSSDEYSRAKGEAEYAISEMGFKRLSIYRPGLLMCDRRQDTNWREWFMQLLLVPIDFINPGWYTTQPVTLAQSMILVTIVPDQEETGEPTAVYSSKDIQTITVAKKQEDMRKIGIRNKNVHIVQLGAQDDSDLVKSRVWLAM